MPKQKAKSHGKLSNPAENFLGTIAKIENFIRENGRPTFIERAKISAGTLQILLKKSLPWHNKSDHEPPRRQLRAWARTLTRVALLLGELPETVCETAGLPVATDIAEAINSEKEKARSTPAARSKVLAYQPAGAVERIKNREKAVGAAKAVKVGIVEASPFVTRFLSHFAARLIGTINPKWGIEEKKDKSIHVLGDGLLKEEPDFDIMLALFDTVHRRFLGFDFLPLYGWKIHLSALCLCSTEEERPSWTQIIEPGAGARFYAIVGDEEAEHHFLSGPCRYPDSHLFPIGNTGDFETFAKELEKTTETYAKSDPAGRTVLVSDSYRCTQVQQILNAGKRPHDRKSTAYVVKEAPESCPTYELSIAFKGGDPRWRELLQAALDKELFGNSNAMTAGMYAQLIVEGYMEHSSNSSRPQEKSCAYQFWKPSYFSLGSAEASEHFWGLLLKRLVEKLREREPEIGKLRARAKDARPLKDLVGDLLPDTCFKSEVFKNAFNEAFGTREAE